MQLPIPITFNLIFCIRDGKISGNKNVYVHKGGEWKIKHSPFSRYAVATEN